MDVCWYSHIPSNTHEHSQLEVDRRIQKTEVQNNTVGSQISKFAWSIGKVLPRFELGLPDSESEVLTITPYDLTTYHYQLIS